MALPELFKVSQKRYLDGNGRRVKSDSPEAIVTIVKSDCWYANIKPVESAAQRIERRKAGLPAPKRKRVKFCESKDASRKMLEQLIDENQNRSVGIKSATKPKVQPLDVIIDDFEKHLLKAGKKKTDDYIRTTVNRVTRVMASCRFRKLSDIDCRKN